MKIITIVALLVVSLPGANAQSRVTNPRITKRAAPAEENTANRQLQLPIRRVVLYSNGVAHFERRGRVTGEAEIDLPFKQSQVDDVLKSLIVLDLGRGRIGAVSYNSSAPPSARLNEIPFSIEASTEQTGSDVPAGGLAAVLGQLQGARVVVTTPTRTARGSILTIEERQSQIDANKPPLVTQLLVIASETGELSSFDLTEVRSVRLLDEGAWHDISEFARATASTRRRDAKTIVVTSTGEGVRELAVSYTVAAPIWKTTYRVVLDDTGKPFFQGWAIVDNVGDEDWTGVELSLVSGTPVSFIQPLQQPLYRHRPVIPIPEYLALEPQVHDTGIGLGRGYNMGGGDPRLGGGDLNPDGVGVGSGSGVGSGMGSGTGPARAGGPATTLSDLITAEEGGVKTAATGKQFGDLFEYRIDQPVTLRRDRSALIPILQTRMEGERISIYNEAARKDRPMSGIRLKNTSPLTLESGSLTVIDGDTYAGEALIERLKPDEQRFISFALDLGTLVSARSKIDREPAFAVRAVNGVLQAHYYQTDKKVYTITNQTNKARTVYIEHPVRDKWTLDDKTQKPAETTASLYRFRVEVAPQETIEFPVTERLALMDSYTLSNLTSDDIKVFVARRYVDEETRGALEKIIEIKGRIAALDRRLSALDREAAEIAADQGRLRENIKALKDTAETKQLIARYVTKAGEQESRIEQIAAERRAITEERARVQTELDVAVRTLALNRKL